MTNELIPRGYAGQAAAHSGGGSFRCVRKVRTSGAGICISAAAAQAADAVKAGGETRWKVPQKPDRPCLSPEGHEVRVKQRLKQALCRGVIPCTGKPIPKQDK